MPIISSSGANHVLGFLNEASDESHFFTSHHHASCVWRIVVSSIAPPTSQPAQKKALRSCDRRATIQQPIRGSNERRQQNGLPPNGLPDGEILRQGNLKIF